MGDSKVELASRSRRTSETLLQGAIDVHVHAGPHLKSSPRSVNPIEAAIEAREAGMRAIVLMDVFQMSSGTAWIANRAVEGMDVYGGIILNTCYGGMNPRAVKTALQYGVDTCRFISFGAHSTYHEAVNEGRYEDGEWILLKDRYPDFAEEELSRAIRIPGDSVPRELAEILEIIAENPDIYLVTGHVSAEEGIRLTELALEYGISKVLISDPVVNAMTDEQIEWAIGQGAYIERLLAGHTHTTTIPKTHYYVEERYRSSSKSKPPTHGPSGVAKVADQIARFGADKLIIGTDYGVYTLPTPVEGLREFIACLMDLGVSTGDIRKVSSINPARLLGLDIRSPR